MDDKEEQISKHCAADPLYHLMVYPQREGFEKAFVEHSIEVLKKRYGSRLLQDGLIMRIFGLLSSIDDSPARFFAAMFMLQWEKSIRNATEDAYSLSEQDSIFGQDAKLHYRDFLRQLTEYVDKTLRFHYNKANAVEVVENFKDACTLSYMNGPFLPQN